MTFPDATLKEKAEILKNDLRLQNSLHGRAMLDLEQELTGRFAKPSVVTAGENAPTYPPAAHWTRTAVPDEPPLGFSVNAVEPVGEQFEVNRNRRGIAEPHSRAPAPDGAGAAATSIPMLNAPATPQRKLWTRPL